MKLKAPEFVTRLKASLKSAPRKPRVKQALRAATASRRMSPAMEDDMDDEPTTRLSSAFFVVLILHLVAVGGIWAFNSIKAHRRTSEGSAAATTKSAAAQSGANAKAPPAPAPSAPVLAEAKSSIAPATVPAVRTGGTYYQVKANDNLSKIAATLAVSVAELQAANDPKEIAVLHPGQVLNVPAKKAVETSATSAGQKKAESIPAKTATERTYIVKKGDTLTSIGKRSGTSTEELVKLNKIKDEKRLQLGATLKLPPK